jgi:hypothetical protein
LQIPTSPTLKKQLVQTGIDAGGDATAREPHAQPDWPLLLPPVVTILEKNSDL